MHFSHARDESNVPLLFGLSIIYRDILSSQIIKIINDALINLLRSESNSLENKRPIKIMMIGLHGSGKTTSAVKLARLLKTKENYKPALIACDVYRPAAIEQLETLGLSENCRVY